MRFGEDMGVAGKGTATTNRLTLRLSVADKNCLRRAAELRGLSVASFVREAALREADATIAQQPGECRSSLSMRLRGRATTGLSTEEVMQHTRGA